MLTEYDWPGNVRELENVIERAVVLTSGPRIGVELIPDHVRKPPTFHMPQFVMPPEGISFKDVITDFEKRLIESTLETAGGVQKRAAELLHIKPTTLNEMIKRYDIRPRRKRQTATPAARARRREIAGHRRPADAVDFDRRDVTLSRLSHLRKQRARTCRGRHPSGSSGGRSRVRCGPGPRAGVASRHEQLQAGDELIAVRVPESAVAADAVLNEHGAAGIHEHRLPTDMASSASSDRLSYGEGQTTTVAASRACIRSGSESRPAKRMNGSSGSAISFTPISASVASPPSLT